MDAPRVVHAAGRRQVLSLKPELEKQVLLLVVLFIAVTVVLRGAATTALLEGTRAGEDGQVGSRNVPRLKRCSALGHSHIAPSIHSLRPNRTSLRVSSLHQLAVSHTDTMVA